MRGTPGHGSLMEWGVTYRQLDLTTTGGIDWDTLAAAVKPGEEIAGGRAGEGVGGAGRGAWGVPWAGEDGVLLLYMT